MILHRSAREKERETMTKGFLCWTTGGGHINTLSRSLYHVEKEENKRLATSYARLTVYLHFSKEKFFINTRKQSPNQSFFFPVPLSLALLHIVHIKHSLRGTREQIYLFLDVRHIQGGNHFFLVGRSCWFCFDAAPSRLPAPSWHPRTQTADHTEGDVRRQAW